MLRATLASGIFDVIHIRNRRTNTHTYMCMRVCVCYFIDVNFKILSFLKKKCKRLQYFISHATTTCLCCLYTSHQLT